MSAIRRVALSPTVRSVPNSDTKIKVQFRLIRKVIRRVDTKDSCSNWRKSSYSGIGNCVEVAPDPASGHVLVRDSKNPSTSRLRLPGAAWTSFIAGLKSGELG